MPDLIQDIPIELTRKRVKYLRVRVCPPEGQVKVSAPHWMPRKTIESFIQEKCAWIAQQQEKIQARKPAPARTYTQDELHPFLGEFYPLRIIEANKPPRVSLTGEGIELRIRPGTTVDKRKELMEGWYRQELKARIPGLIQKYEPRMGVTVNEFGVKRMKTRWGTCNPKAGRIWLGLELAKKPPECLEYVVVHEMVHLLEASHNKRFWGLVERYMPDWQIHKRCLSDTAFS